MNFFCRILGHTWVPTTDAPDPRWNTTKDGHVLQLTATGDVRHYERCQRCSDRRDLTPPVREQRESSESAPAAS